MSPNVDSKRRKLSPSFKMKNMTNISSLNHDCLLKILSYLSLHDCLNLIALCKSLHDAVVDHFSKVQTLSLLLSDHYSVNDYFDYYHYFIAKTTVPMKKFVRSSFDAFYGIPDRQLGITQQSFGVHSGRTNPLVLFEDYSILEHQNHFKREDFMILYQMDDFSSMINFISTHFTGITKLALIIDRHEYFDDIDCILDMFSGKLKVLLIERTLRDGCRVANEKLIKNGSRWKHEKNGRLYGPIRHTLNLKENRIELSDKIYRSLIKHTALEELYFFPKNISQFSVLPIYANKNQPPIGEAREIVDDFIETMLCQLRIFHMNFYTKILTDKLQPVRRISTYKFPCEKEVYEKLEELRCYDKITVSKSVRFPNLNKCYFTYIPQFDYENRNFVDLEPFRNVTVLHTQWKFVFINVSFMIELSVLIE